MRVIPIVNLSADLMHLRGRREIGRAGSEVIRVGQGVAVNCDRVFPMGSDRNNAVRTKRGEGRRFQKHAWPHFSGAEIIDESER